VMLLMWPKERGTASSAYSSESRTIRSGDGYGRGRRRMPWTSETTTVDEPMPRPSVITANAVNPGCRPINRSAYRTSAMSSDITTSLR